MLVNGQHNLKIMRCEQQKIFKVSLVIFQHYARKGYGIFKNRRLLLIYEILKTRKRNPFTSFSKKFESECFFTLWYKQEFRFHKLKDTNGNIVKLT